MTSLPFAGVVFDLDGTFDIHKHIVGKPDHFGVQFVADAVGGTADHIRKIRDEHMEALMPTAIPLPGALECVSQFKATGVPIAIATSSQADHVRLKQDANPALFALVDAVVCGQDPRVKAGKPSPDIFLAAAADIGVDPSKCWAFEDAPAGVLAAKAAGMFVFAIPDPRMDISLFSTADVILTDIASFKLSDYTSK